MKAGIGKGNQHWREVRETGQEGQTGQKKMIRQKGSVRESWKKVITRREWTLMLNVMVLSCKIT